MLCSEKLHNDVLCAARRSSTRDDPLCTARSRDASLCTSRRSDDVLWNEKLLNAVLCVSRQSAFCDGVLPVPGKVSAAAALAHLLRSAAAAWAPMCGFAAADFSGCCCC